MKEDVLDPGLVAVILAGGGGSRLWPLSTEHLPKPFLSLLGSDSPFTETVKRLNGLCPPENLRVVCGERHRVHVLAALQGLGTGTEDTVLAEPVGRNTAAAMALAAQRLTEGGNDPVMAVLPSDHLIADPAAFRQCLKTATSVATETGAIVTLGIVPTAPETGYGYILVAGETDPHGSFPVAQFKEKPTVEQAQAFIDRGDAYWNAGIFVARASVIRDEIQRHAPGVDAGIRAFLLGEREAYETVPALSFDVAVMEQTGKARLLPAAFGWSDLGSWIAVHRASSHDAFGNSASGPVVLKDCRNSYFRAERRLLAGLGVRDLLVVEAGNKVLVAGRAHCGNGDPFFGEARAFHLADEPESPTDYRPWGSFTILSDAANYKVKRLDILPGKRFSLQTHRHRSEHWVIVGGKAKVTRGEEVFELGPGQHTMIPAGFVHRLENPGTELLSVIEIQLGSYFGEDDIVRLEDDFGRIEDPC